MAPRQGQNEDAHVADDIIASLARELRGELAALDSSAAPQVTVASPAPILIAEVSRLTRNVDPAEYDPHHVSIGPYHRLINADLARDKEKISCLRDLLSAASDGVALEAYLDEMARLEAPARSCYTHSFQQLSTSEFVRMLLLDACYLLVRFGAAVVSSGGAPAGKAGDAAAAAPPPAGCRDNMVDAVDVVRDVFYLAENQIPFFVVERVYQLTFPDREASAARTLFADYAQRLLHSQEYALGEPDVAATEAPGNLLCILRRNLKPTGMVKDGAATLGALGRWRRATEYHSCGIAIRSRSLSLGKVDDRTACRSVLDVKLDRGRGTLEIPRLNIDSETPRLLRNLMALEQSNPESSGSYVTAYCVFLSQLACTEGDVELLSRRGVITHAFGNDGEVTAMFSDLCKGIVFSVNDPSLNYLAATWEALEGLCRRRRGRSRGGYRASSLPRVAGRVLLCL